MKVLLTTILPLLGMVYVYNFLPPLYATIVAAVLLLYILFFHAATFVMISGAMIYKKKPKKALARMLKSLDMKFGKPKTDYVIYTSYVCLREGEFEKAEEILNKIYKMKLSYDQQLRTDMNYALLLWKKGNIDEAIELLQKLHDGGESSNIYGNLGYFLILSGDMQRALEYNLKGYEYDSSSEAIIDNLALTYYHLGEYEKSAELYKGLIRKQLPMPIPYYNYGELLYAMGDKEGAIEQMEEALSYNFTALAAVSKKQIRERIAKIEAELEAEK